ARAGAQALLDGGVAAGPAEEEQDRRQQALPVEPFDDVGAARGEVAPAAAAPAALVPADAAQHLAGVAEQLGVYLVLGGRLRVVEQVEHPAADQHVLPQRYRRCSLTTAEVCPRT